MTVQDEIYIVQTGTGTLVRGEENIPYGPGDALFVAASVIFYGPTGGES